MEQPKAMNEYEIMFCLASIVQGWDDLPDFIKTRVAEHDCDDELQNSIFKARKLVDYYAKHNAIKAGRFDNIPPANTET